MASYIQEVEQQNEELREKLEALEERCDILSEAQSFITTLHTEKIKDYASVDIADFFGVPKLLVNSFNRSPIYFCSRTLDEAVLLIILNKRLGCAVYKHRLWTIEHDSYYFKKTEDPYTFTGRIYISSDFRTIVVDTWEKNKDPIITERVKTLLSHGEYEVNENGMARL